MNHNTFNSSNKKKKKKLKTNNIDLTNITSNIDRRSLNTSKQNLSNVIYFPIGENISPTGKKRIIYLSSRNTPQKKYMLPQRSIDFQINKIDFKKFNRKLLLKNENSKRSRNVKINSGISKNQSNTKKFSPNSVLDKSNSVGCYSEMLNNSYTSPLLIDYYFDSKIVNGNFISSIKSVRRRNELEKSLEKLKKIKSINRGNTLNSFCHRTMEQIIDENDRAIEGNDKTLNEKLLIKTKINTRNKKINDLKKKANFETSNNTKKSENKTKNRIINNYEKNVKNLNNKTPPKSKLNKNNTNCIFSQKIVASCQYRKKKKYVNSKKNSPIRRQIELNNTKITAPFSPQPILVRKVLREEHYYIDSQGKEKIIEVIQSPITNEKLKKSIINKNNLHNARKEINKYDKNILLNLQNCQLIKVKKHSENNKSIVTPSEIIKNNPKEILKLINSIKIYNPVDSTVQNNINNNNNPSVKIPIKIKNELFNLNSNSNLINKVIINPKSYNDSSYTSCPPDVKRRSFGNVSRNNHLFHEIKNLSKNFSNKDTINSKFDKNSYSANTMNNNNISSFSIISNEINPNSLQKNPIMFSANNIFEGKEIINKDNMIFDNKINNLYNKNKNLCGVTSDYSSIINDNMKFYESKSFKKTYSMVNFCNIQNRSVIKNDSTNNSNNNFQQNRNNNLKVYKTKFYVKSSDDYLNITNSNYDSKKLNDNKLKKIILDNKNITSNNKTTKKLYNLKKNGITDKIKIKYFKKVSGH